VKTLTIICNPSRLDAEIRTATREKVAASGTTNHAEPDEIHLTGSDPGIVTCLLVWRGT
jgi:hypothetical protein